MFKAFELSRIPGETFSAIDRIRAAGTAGERIIVHFWIVADDDVENVRIRASRHAGDVWVVKRWKQAGIGLHRSSAVEVDELLLKDDRGSIPAGRYGRRWSRLRSVLRGRRFYLPPRIRLTGDVKTSFVAGHKKQFVLLVRVPQTTVPGDYTGELRFVSGGVTQSFPFELKVWPIRLAEPPQDLLLWYKATMKEWQTQHFVPPVVASRQFRDIAGIGFKGISIADAEPKFLAPILRRARRAGLRGPFILMPPYDEQTHLLTTKLHVSAMYYVSDEADVNGEDEIRRHRENSNKVAGWYGRTICSIINYGSRGVFHDAVADVESLYLPANTEYFRLRAEFPELRRRKIYYYWMCHMEKPQLNRVLAGVYLWKSRADGIVPYCYQHLPLPPSSPFDDFSDWQPGFHIGEDRRPFRHHMATYPAHRGVLWTVQWLGLADGIIDLRYLSTLDQLLERVRGSGVESCQALADQIERDIKRFTDRIELNAIDINSETNPEPYLNIAPGEYEQFRMDVAKSIITLQSALKDAGYRSNDNDD